MERRRRKIPKAETNELQKEWNWRAVLAVCTTRSKLGTSILI
jgi:hypothetical protein